MPIVSIRNTNIYQGENCVIEDLNFDLQPSEFVYLIGKTGSGKTSLLRTLYADLELRKGQVYVDDFQIHDLKRKQIPFLRRKLGIIFQDFELFTDRSVEENLYFVMKATGWSSKLKMSQKVDELLEQVGLTGYQTRMPHQLSGGEKQRVAIARALINNPVLLLADEPTGNLDPIVANDILNLFIRISKEKGMAVLMATHHHNFLRTVPARVLYCDGGIVKDVSKEKVESRMEN
ncbi:MAG: cell division transport system ATP-binding protein [Flammeovirgaceae bacterium]|jgi:cell division transport system ATP-binding protein